jgi:hypothetical protein
MPKKLQKLLYFKPSYKRNHKQYFCFVTKHIYALNSILRISTQEKDVGWGGGGEGEQVLL